MLFRNNILIVLFQFRGNPPKQDNGANPLNTLVQQSIYENNEFGAPRYN